MGNEIDTNFDILKFRTKDFIIHCVIERLPVGTTNVFETGLIYKVNLETTSKCCYNSYLIT